MLSDQFCYRVRFQGDARDVCIIEADAPIDAARLQGFIRKTRRVFKLADDVEIRVIELRQVVERRNVTSEILGDEPTPSQQERMDIISRIQEEHLRDRLAG